MTARPRFEAAIPKQLWMAPWPQVAELSAVASSEIWTLIGGLMIQLHAMRHQVDVIRPTTDIDALLHIETGVTQALRRTETVAVSAPGATTFILSVPNAFGALMLKAAAYINDSRDRERHIGDAAVLLACIDDPRSLPGSFAGSDRHWLALGPEARSRARRVIAILAAA